jgi:hypothetical protein
VRRADVVGNALSLCVVESPAPKGLIGPKAPDDFPALPHSESSAYPSTTGVFIEDQPAHSFAILRLLYRIDADLTRFSCDNVVFALGVHDMGLANPI